MKTKTGWKNQLSAFECMLICGCVLSAVLMYIRVCFGTEITDEAFYVADALAMTQGNIPYAYNNFSYGTGSAFLLVPQLFLYQLFVPDCEGVFLFTRFSYVTFCMVILLLVFRIMCKFASRQHALLLLGLMAPYSAFGIANYSYNSIPKMLGYFVGFLLYDVVECKEGHRFMKLVAAGFLSGIFVLAHPGYGLAVIVFLVLLFTRSARAERWENLCAYAVGGIMEILVVIVPIVFQVGVQTLWDGIFLYIKPYPSGSLSQVSRKDKIFEVLTYSRPILAVMAVAVLAAVCLMSRHIGEENKKRMRKNCFMFGISAGMLLNLILFWRTHSVPDEMYSLGILASICAALLLVTGFYKDAPVLLYIGIYPAAFAVAEVVVVNSSASVSRFGAAVPALSAVLLLLLEGGSRQIRFLATACIVACILLAGYEDYFYVYRDEPVWKLDGRVEEGIYKGIYTTQARAGDLPELEGYLNDMVGKDEYYAFRDNVPCGYLMVHQGKMCDVATWDKLQYTYGRNAPAGLYAYYKRRDAIPDKVIYVDYGRDGRLSVDDPDFRYNDFIKAYYKLVDDRKLNGTFYRVKVYQYQGGFDGSYDYWIDTYKDVL